MTGPRRPRQLAARRPAARTRALLAAALSLALMTLTTGTVLVGLPAPSLASSTVSTGLSTGMSTGGSAAGGAGTSGSGTGGTSAVVPIATTTTSPVQVFIDQFAGVAAPDLPLTLKGHITVPKGTPLEGLTAQVYAISGGVDSRAGLAKLRADPTLGGKAAYTSRLTDAVPVENLSFTINQPPKIQNKPLTIYAMKIAVLAGAKPVGAAYTFLVWAPQQPTSKAVSVTTVVPIADYPRLRSDGLLTDNKLADEIKGPTGRLYRILQAVTSVDRQSSSSIALAVDPTLLKALNTMTGPTYPYADPGGQTTARYDPDAKAFLDQLSAFAATPGNTVFALPWGDADLSALVRAAGQHDDGQLYDAKWAVNTGKTIVDGLLKITNSAPVAYPGDGLADSAMLNFLANNGMTTAILDDRLLPATSTKVTPTALTVQQTASGPIRALAADSTLTGLLSPKIGTAGPSEDQALADVLAELAMTTYENRSTTTNRLTVLALPRLWDPPTTDWATRVLQKLAPQADTNPGYQPFVRPVPLPVAPVNGPDNAQSAQGGAGAFTPAGTRRGYVYPESALSTETPTAYVDAVEHLRTEVRQLDPALCAVRTAGTATANPSATDTTPCALTQSLGGAYKDSRATVIQPMLRTLLTALSVDWRSDRPGAIRLAQEVDGRIHQIRGSIEVVASSKVTLTSRHGAVPLSVQIKEQPGFTPLPMTVILSLSSNDRTRLQSGARVPVTVVPGVHNQLEIKVSSDAAGTFAVNVRVLSPDGQLLSTGPFRILVRSTVYGAIATAITYVTIGLFAAAVVLRQVRRSRRKRRGGGTGSGGGPVDNLTPDSGLTGPNGLIPGDAPTTPVRRIQANAAGTQRMDVERAYAGGVPANPSEP